jgi:hypothetical protein
LSKASLPTGSVLQVVQANYATEVTNSTTTYADTGLTASITPTSATSKILVLVSQPTYKGAGNAGSGTNVKVLRGATDLGALGYGLGYTNTSVGNSVPASISYLDSPATTSSTTYKTQLANSVSAAYASTCWNNSTATITLMEIAA